MPDESDANDPDGGDDELFDEDHLVETDVDLFGETESGGADADVDAGADEPDASGDDAEDDADSDETSTAADLVAVARVELREMAAAVAAPDYRNGLVGLLYGMVLAPLLVLTPVVRALPATWKVYQKLHKWSAYQMQKAASADAVSTTRLRNGKVDALPAKYVEASEDDKNRSGWKVKGLGDKRYDPAIHGNTTTRFGKADLIAVDEDGTDQATFAEATIDNAFQLDRERYLFRDATVSMTNVIHEIHKTADGAMTDGGQREPEQELRKQEVSLTRPGVLEDVLVPVNSRPGYDGQVVSWNQYQHVKSEQSDQETIRDAKNQAWAAAKLDDIQTKDLFKWVLILGAIGAVLLFHQELGAAIASIGGGGAGGAAGEAAGGALG